MLPVVRFEQLKGVLHTPQHWSKKHVKLISPSQTFLFDKYLNQVKKSKQRSTKHFENCSIFELNQSKDLITRTVLVLISHVYEKQEIKKLYQNLFFISSIFPMLKEKFSKLVFHSLTGEG